MQPILVRETKPGSLKSSPVNPLWRSGMAGSGYRSTLVKQIDEHALGIGLIENIQREDFECHGRGRWHQNA